MPEDIFNIYPGDIIRAGKERVFDYLGSLGVHGPEPRAPKIPGLRRLFVIEGLSMAGSSEPPAINKPESRTTLDQA